MKTNFTKAQIRKFLVLYYGLNRLDSLGCGKEGILAYFDRVHSIQSDPLNIVGKNIEIALAARISDFSPQMLDEMMYSDKLLVDGYDKEACIYLMSEWKQFHHIRKVRAQVVDQSIGHLDQVYEHVKENPSVCSKDIQVGKSKNDRWGSSSLSNRALYYLWCNGDIVVDKRIHGNKYYALSESIVPAHIYNEEIMEDEQFLQWYYLRRLESLGLYRVKRGPGWLGHYFKDMKLIKSLTAQALKENQIIEITIEDMKDKFYMSLRNYKLLLNSLETELSEAIRFIAPLDNFIWDRKLVKELFDFEYTWEVYVPEEKRKYGYYVLPVLYKDELIARIEPSRDKNRRNKLKIEKIWYEDTKYKTKEIERMIKDEVKRYNAQMK